MKARQLDRGWITSRPTISGMYGCHCYTHRAAYGPALRYGEDCGGRSFYSTIPSARCSVRRNIQHCLRPRTAAFPLNVNDFEMQADMRKAPVSHDTSAIEALFAVVRSELAYFVRHSVFHVSVVGGTPSPDMIAHSNREGDEL
ncbi:hypothetical protein GX50_04949 [[Emmonsia] crescens]|uniref:Uncharacterized protein n=1 Tax=[Emmonsia] crescens TaxID=73230 RepID=A0A2B7ZGZ2_9EURO|nr:hypothetical protein GX50_04949 [Emmonsia crescens]